MKRVFWIVVAVLLIIGAILVLHVPKYTQKPNGEIVLNDVLTLQQMQISSFDPLDAYHAGHIQIVKQLYNTLVDIDLNGRPIPSLAERWESRDGITWRFYLRKNVYFIEAPCFINKTERIFTARDVKYTFERLLNKDSKSLGISYFTNILGAEKYRKGESNSIEGIKIVDDYIIDFVLKEREFSFPNSLALPYVSIVKDKAVEYYKDVFSQHPVGTGPFILQEYEPNKKIFLVKNRNYWEQEGEHQLPYVDKVVIHLSTDDNLALLMFKDQKTDFLELSFSLLKQLKTINMSVSYKTETQENPQLNFYLFNLEKIRDANIRKAVNYAINRDELQKIIAEEGNVTKGLYPSSIFKELAVSKEILNYNPEEAKNHLKNLKVLKLVSFEDILSKSIADFIARTLKQYNVNVKIESVPFPVLVDRLTKGEYDLIQIYWGPMYADVNHYLNPFLTSSFPPIGNNFNKYSNAEFDRLVTTAKSLSLEKQKENFIKAEDVILNDMPFLLLYFKKTIRASNGRFDLPLHPLQYRLYKYAKRK